MIIVTVYVPGGCKFNEDEFDWYFNAAIEDTLNLENDPPLIHDCIFEYTGEIKEETPYTFFLHRANIATAHPGYEPAFDIWQVIPSLNEVNIQL